MKTGDKATHEQEQACIDDEGKQAHGEKIDGNRHEQQERPERDIEKAEGQSDPERRDPALYAHTRDKLFREQDSKTGQKEM